MATAVTTHHFPSAPQTGAADVVALEDLEVRAISTTEWRVRDARLPEHDALCVLGIIQHRPDETYEALRIGHGFQRSTFATLQQAVDSYAGSERTTHYAPTSYGRRGVA